MKRKKLITGAIIMALTLTTGVAAYAATDSQEKEIAYQKEISMSSEDALSLEDIDKNNLPEGVHYTDEISVTDESATSFRLDE